MEFLKMARPPSLSLLASSYIEFVEKVRSGNLTLKPLEGRIGNFGQKWSVYGTSYLTRAFFGFLCIF